MTHGDIISFRTATPADIPVIQDLASRIWRQHYPGIISSAQIEYMLTRMYAAEVIRSEMEHGGHRYVLVSSSAGDAGFLSFRLDADGAAAVLSKIYLLRSLQGRGIGRRMLQYAVDQARAGGARSLSLSVNRNNVRAIRAYERFGFTRHGSVVTDIGGGFVMDDHHMVFRW